MLLNIPDILLLLLIFQLLFTSIYLISKKSGKPISNYLLGSFFLGICIATADNLLLRIGTWYSYPAFATLSSAFPFLYGPLLLLYTRSLIYKSFATRKTAWLHFIMFMLFFLVSVISYEVQPVAIKLHILHNINSHRLSLYFYAGSLIMVVHFIGYAIAALRLIKKYRSLALNNFSSMHKNSLHWLSSTIIFFLVIFIIVLLNNLFEFGAMVNVYPVSLLIIILLLFYFINTVLFKALNYPEYFLLVENNEVAVKIKKSTMQPDDKSAELRLVAAYMEQHKPYLDPDLTIQVLARSMRMQTKDLSNLINEYLQQNFFDFINRYRIDEARRLLINNPDKKMTVLEILYKTGFNSKSSFNTLFKKYTGMTPTEFKTKNL